MKTIAELYGDKAGPVMWNPWNKVVQDHRDGTIHKRATNKVRKFLGLSTPWTPYCADIDTRTPGIHLK
jgi:hypothetical protein